MTYEERRQILADAAASEKIVDNGVMDFVKLIVGRLKRAYTNDATYWNAQSLKKLKKELRDFDMTTNRWKD